MVKSPLWVATFLVAAIIAVAPIWFFFNQQNTSNNDVKITAFSVDTEGWKDPPDSWASCAFNITVENAGPNDVQGLWLKVTMFGFGENFVRNPKGCTNLAVSGNLSGFTLSAGEIRTFQGEMHGGTTMDGINRSPVGATYLAQLVVGSSNVLDEAEWTDPFATIFIVAAIATGVAVIIAAIYIKKRKH